MAKNSLLTICIEHFEEDDVIITEDELNSAQNVQPPPQVIQEVVRFEEIPDQIYWESVLGSLECCNNWSEMESVAE